MCVCVCVCVWSSCAVSKGNTQLHSVLLYCFCVCQILDGSSLHTWTVMSLLHIVPCTCGVLISLCALIHLTHMQNVNLIPIGLLNQYQSACISYVNANMGPLVYVLLSEMACFVMF